MRCAEMWGDVGRCTGLRVEAGAEGVDGDEEEAAVGAEDLLGRYRRDAG